MTISRSVGIGGTNHADDVRVVQGLLNVIAEDGGGPPVSLELDGIAGTETIRAIKRFQSVGAGFRWPDGRVDPGGRTLVALLAAGADDGDPTPPGGGVDPDVVPATQGTLDAWLQVPLAGWTSSTTTSSVHVHTTGGDALASFEAALRRCVSDAAVVLIAGWDFYENTPLTKSTKVGDALRDAANRGTRVRALFNHFPALTMGQQIGQPTVVHNVGPGDNTRATAFVNSLPNGAALHDAWLLHRDFAGWPAVFNPVQVGVHHQKAWVVSDGEEVRAWVGGVDFNPNRSPHGPRAPLHDVHAELGGPAASDVYQMLRERWNDHPSKPSVKVPAPPLRLGVPTAGGQRARILTTFGNPRSHAGLQAVPYPFAPSGSTSIQDFVHYAIDKAQRFIYIEDQYLVDEEIAKRLARAMPHLSALIIVICATNSVNSELHQGWRRRQLFLDHLKPHSANVAIVASNHFVHSKLWVFDDEVALVSSANINRRGFGHDSEIGVAFGDLVWPGEVGRMRSALWARHLGAAAPGNHVAPETTLGLWKAPPPGAQFSVYAPTAGTDTSPVPTVTIRKIPILVPLSTDQFWDQIIDPTS